MPLRLKPSVRAWMDKHLDPDWINVHKLWSIQVAFFGSIAAGLWAALPAFQSVLPPVYFALACVTVSVATMLARMAGQDVGPDDRGSTDHDR